nr:MAG TPA: hypothetical protein [Caudoviricetes sp.]
MQDPFVSLDIQKSHLCNTPQVKLKIQLISPSKSAKCCCYKHKSGRRKILAKTPRNVVATNTLSLLQTHVFPCYKHNFCLYVDIITNAMCL